MTAVMRTRPEVLTQDFIFVFLYLCCWFVALSNSRGAASVTDTKSDTHFLLRR